jgi:hypothetical protein
MLHLILKSVYKYRVTGILTQDSQIKALLQQFPGQTKTIAVVGLSPDPTKPSYEVSSYLKSKGYKIVPVRPDTEELLGEKAYTSLSEIPFPIDIVDIFRRVEFIPEIVDEAIKIGAKAVWMQLGLEHEQAAKKATSNGMDVVMDRCLLIEHKKIFG